MQKFEKSKQLAEALCKTGSACGVKTQAVISDMNQPLGKYVGNALEVFECIKILRGEADEEMSPTLELSTELSARMLVLTGIAETVENAKLKIKSVLDSGEALEKFRHNIELQNGDSKICDNPEILFGKDLVKVEVQTKKSGFVTEIDATVIGESISRIGGGRIKVGDKIDYAVGYECVKKLGDAAQSGETLGVIFCRNETQANLIYEKLANAYKIVDEKPLENFDLIKAVI
jgi:pyrimidine-nucleoside phosphorylase